MFHVAWLVFFSGLAFVGAFYLQFHFFTAFAYLPSASIFFLPAGVKLLAMLLARHWGLLGLWLGNNFIEAVFNEVPLSWEPYVLRPLIYLSVPYLTMRLWMRGNRVSDDLENLSLYHVVMLAITTSFAGALVFQAYLSKVFGATQPLSSAVWGMTVGDVSGVIGTLIVWVAARRMISSLRRRSSADDLSPE